MSTLRLQAELSSSCRSASGTGTSLGSQAAYVSQTSFFGDLAQAHSRSKPHTAQLLSLRGSKWYELSYKYSHWISEMRIKLFVG